MRLLIAAEAESYLQSEPRCCSCPGGQLCVSAALERVGGAAADGRTGISPRQARGQDTGQREQEPDHPESHDVSHAGPELSLKQLFKYIN